MNGFNKWHYIRYYVFALILFFAFANPIKVRAQIAMGMDGLLYVPTAENVESGKFMVGANYLPKEALPPYFTKTYNSGNYFVDFNLFSFFEICYRMTMMKGENGKMNQQDRSYTIKLKPVSEGKYRPGIAIGITDPFTDHGVNAYESYYGVLTKGMNLGKSRLNLSFGSYVSFKSKAKQDARHKDYGTVFGGLAFEPGFCRNLRLIAEYDSKVYNAGISARFFNHLSVNAFLYDMKNFSAGIRYEYVIKH